MSHHYDEITREFKESMSQNQGFEALADFLSEVRKFETGATRSPLGDKLQYEGFLSPLVLREYAEYMHRHRFQSDGQLRDSDNWQKGMPLRSYMDSGWRHFMDWWLHERGYMELAQEPKVEALCALMFNVMGYLHEVLKEKNGSVKGTEKGTLPNWQSQEPPDTPYRVGFEAKD